MTSAQPTPEQIAAAERFVFGPAKGDPVKARKRQIWAVARMLMWCDTLIAEAADAHIKAYGLLELREWLVFNLDEHACAEAPPLNIQPDPVKDAVAGSVAAARSGNAERYEAARVAEAAARIQVAEKPAAELEAWA